MAYVYSRTGGKAATYLYPGRKEDSTKLYTLASEIIATLTRYFDNLEAKADAKRDYKDLI